MPGIGLVIEGAMQHAPQPGRHACSLVIGGKRSFTGKFLKHRRRQARQTRILPAFARSALRRMPWRLVK
jgi:hypothetical protein